MEYKLIIGVDVSKKTLDMTALQGSNAVGTHKTFLNKKLGYENLLKWIREYCIELNEVLICMEHTGYYIYGLCSYLQKQGINYSVVNPMQIKKSMGIQRVKTDKKDSAIIALYA